jgi:hypothetical protein
LEEILERKEERNTRKEEGIYIERNITDNDNREIRNERNCREKLK